MWICLWFGYHQYLVLKREDNTVLTMPLKFKRMSAERLLRQGQYI